MALNSLEALTANTPVLDSNQVERFKNGILVDNFQSGTTADSGRLDFTASLDTANGELRTAYNNFVVQFATDIANSTSVGVVLVGEMAILSYNTAPWIVQSLATDSISVNPFNVASFYGVVQLAPAVNVWQDTINAPAQVVDLGGPTAAWVAANDPTFVNWGAWTRPTMVWSRPIQLPRFLLLQGGQEQTIHQTLKPKSILIISRLRRHIHKLGLRIVMSQFLQQPLSGIKLSIRRLFRSAVNVILSLMRPDSNQGRISIPSLVGHLLKDTFNRPIFFNLGNRPGNTSPFYIGQTVYVEKALTGFAATTNNNTSLAGYRNRLDI